MRTRRPVALTTAALLALGAGACQDDGADEGDDMPDEQMDDDMDDDEM